MSPMMQANLSALKSAHAAHAVAAANAQHAVAAANAQRPAVVKIAPKPDQASGRQKQSGKAAQGSLPNLPGGAPWQTQQGLQPGHPYLQQQQQQQQQQHMAMLQYNMAMQGLAGQTGMQPNMPYLTAAMASGQPSALSALQLQALARQGGGLNPEALGQMAGSAGGLSGLLQAPGGAAEPMAGAQSALQRHQLELLTAQARLSGGLLGNRPPYGVPGSPEGGASPHLLQSLLLKDAQQRGASAQVPQGAAGLPGGTGQLGQQPTHVQTLNRQQQQPLPEYLLQGAPPGQLAQQLGALQQRARLVAQARHVAQAQLADATKDLARGSGAGDLLLDQAKRVAAAGRGEGHMYGGGGAAALAQADPASRLSKKRSLLDGRQAQYMKRPKQAQKLPAQAPQQVPGRANLGLAAQLQARDAVHGANPGGVGLCMQDLLRQQLQAAGTSAPGASGLSEEALQKLMAERQLAVAVGAGPGPQTTMPPLQTGSRDAALQSMYANLQTLQERSAMAADLGPGAGPGPGFQAPAGLNFGTLPPHGPLSNAGMPPQLQEAHFFEQQALAAGSEGAVPRHGAPLSLAASLQASLPRGGVEDFARETGQSVPGGLSAGPSLQDLLPKNEVYRFLKGKE